MRIFVKLEKDNKRLFEYHPGEMGKLEFTFFMPVIGDTIIHQDREYRVIKIVRLHKDKEEEYGVRSEQTEINIMVKEN